MFYIKRIKLVNYVQYMNRGVDTIEVFFDKNKKINIIRGEVGKGKTTLVTELQPFPNINGYNTIVAGYYGEKIIEYGSMGDSVEYICRHVFVPENKRHNVKSFFTEIVNGIEKKLVEGSVTEFKNVVSEKLGITEQSLRITGYGLKYGKNTFNFIEMSDSERYYYLRTILNMDKIKEYLDIIINKSRLNKSLITKLSHSIADVVDFDKITDDFKSEIKIYSNTRDKTKLDISDNRRILDDMNNIDISERESLNELLRRLAPAEGVMIDDNTNYRVELEDVNNRLLELKILINERQISIGNKKAELLTNKQDYDINSINKQLKENINLKEELEKSIDYSICRSEEDILFMDKVFNIMNNLVPSLSYPFSEYVNYNKTKIDITSEISDLNTEYDEISNMTITELEKEIDATNISCSNKCKLLDLQNKIKDKVNHHYSQKDRLVIIQKRLHDLSDDLYKHDVIMSKKDHIMRVYNRLKEINTELDRFFNSKIDIDVFVNDFWSFNERYNNIKYISSNVMKLNHVNNNIKTLETQLKSFKDREEHIKEIKENILTMEEEFNKLLDENDSLKKCTLLKIQNIVKDYPTKKILLDAIKNTSDKLYIINTAYDKISSLKQELDILDKRLKDLDNLIDKKQNELSDMLVRKSIYERDSLEYSEQIRLKDILEKGKNVFGKKIPSIMIEYYMSNVKEIANNILEDTKYRIHDYHIHVDDKRVMCDFDFSVGENIIPMGLLSNGETAMAYLSIILSSNMILFNNYDILRLDEIDKAFHKELKEEFINMMIKMNLSQVFIITHNDYANIEDDVNIIYI